jgi:hypothetical protein
MRRWSSHHHCKRQQQHNWVGSRWWRWIRWGHVSSYGTIWDDRRGELELAITAIDRNFKEVKRSHRSSSLGELESTTMKIEEVLYLWDPEVSNSLAGRRLVAWDAGYS